MFTLDESNELSENLFCSFFLDEMNPAKKFSSIC